MACSTGWFNAGFHCHKNKIYKTMNRIKERYNRISGVYDYLELPMESVFSKWRKELLREAYGETLEVGIGTGKNLPYYPEGIVLTGIDFSENMLNRARRKARKSTIQTHLKVMDAQNLQFADNSFDTVVSFCVFCSVPDPVRGLQEIMRVCRNGGKIIMMEHVRSEQKVIGKLMDVLNPIPCRLIGENLNRPTYFNLLKAGFKEDNIEVKNLWFDIVKHFRIRNIN